MIKCCRKSSRRAPAPAVVEKVVVVTRDQPAVQAHTNVTVQQPISREDSLRRKLKEAEARAEAAERRAGYSREESLRRKLKEAEARAEAAEARRPAVSTTSGPSAPEAYSQIE